MIEAENLKLPLCPKCGDTKFVKESPKLIPVIIWHCSKCNIEWLEHG